MGIQDLAEEEKKVRNELAMQLAQFFGAPQATRIFSARVLHCSLLVATSIPALWADMVVSITEALSAGQRLASSHSSP